MTFFLQIPRICDSYALCTWYSSVKTINADVLFILIFLEYYNPKKFVIHDVLCDNQSYYVIRWCKGVGELFQAIKRAAWNTISTRELALSLITN